MKHSGSKAFKIYESQPNIGYNPALPEAHGTEQISDEDSGNIGMQEALERGTDDADRTRLVDVDVYEPHHPTSYTKTDRKRSLYKGE
jgi:hypothetical protein